MKRCSTVEEYIEASPSWGSELKQLRKILRSTDLEETVKWSAPCYTFGGKNVVGMGAYKSYFGLWFFQGAQLADRDEVLINAQAGRTKAMRQWRFESKNEIDARRIKAYVEEAIGVEAEGRAIKPERNKLLVLAPEIEQALKRDAKARASFRALTPGRQREYSDYVAEAKRDETRRRRLDKILPLIRAGRGLNDKYRNC
ncbi:MAG: hypothetical protein GY716_00625 [bacterium]|nr:hypothetical protein [bacterium]